MIKEHKRQKQEIEIQSDNISYLWKGTISKYNAEKTPTSSCPLLMYVNN